MFFEQHFCVEFCHEMYKNQSQCVSINFVSKKKFYNVDLNDHVKLQKNMWLTMSTTSSFVASLYLRTSTCPHNSKNVSLKITCP